MSSSLLNNLQQERESSRHGRPSYDRGDSRGHERGYERGGRRGESRREDRYRERDGGDRRGPRRKSPERFEKLDNVTPLHLRKRILNAWDKEPPGCEGMTVQQVKLSGLFPYPGEPAKNTYLSATGGLDALGYNPEVFSTKSAHGDSALKANRRLYVANYPEEIKERQLVDYLNDALRSNRISTSIEPVVSVEIRKSKKFAIATFKSAEDATKALELNGVDIRGHVLEIRKPQGSEDAGTTISPNVMDTPNKVFIGSLPTFLNDEQVMELLKAFGELRSFNLVKDSSTGLSKGFAFCEYLEPEMAELACQGLHGMELGDKRLILHRSNPNRPGKFRLRSSDVPLLPVDILAHISSGPPTEPTRVLMLLNMITAEDLMDDSDFNDIHHDIASECALHGRIKQILIPRPKFGEKVQGVGKIYVVFENNTDALNCQKSIAGRIFNDRSIITGFYDEEKFNNGELI